MANFNKFRNTQIYEVVQQLNKEHCTLKKKEKLNFSISNKKGVQNVKGLYCSGSDIWRKVILNKTNWTFNSTYSIEWNLTPPTDSTKDFCKLGTFNLTKCFLLDLISDGFPVSKDRSYFEFSKQNKTLKKLFLKTQKISKMCKAYAPEGSESKDGHFLKISVLPIDNKMKAWLKISDDLFMKVSRDKTQPCNPSQLAVLDNPNSNLQFVIGVGIQTEDFNKKTEFNSILCLREEFRHQYKFTLYNKKPISNDSLQVFLVRESSEKGGSARLYPPESNLQQEKPSKTMPDLPKKIERSDQSFVTTNSSLFNPMSDCPCRYRPYHSCLSDDPPRMTVPDCFIPSVPPSYFTTKRTHYSWQMEDI